MFPIIFGLIFLLLLVTTAISLLKYKSIFSVYNDLGCLIIQVFDRSGTVLKRKTVSIELPRVAEGKMFLK